MIIRTSTTSDFIAEAFIYLFYYFIYFLLIKNYFFAIPWQKVPLSLLAQKRECGILAFGSGGNLHHEIYTVQVFAS